MNYLKSTLTALGNTIELYGNDHPYKFVTIMGVSAVMAISITLLATFGQGYVLSAWNHTATFWAHKISPWLASPSGMPNYAWVGISTGAALVGNGSVIAFPYVKRGISELKQNLAQKCFKSESPTFDSEPDATYGELD